MKGLNSSLFANYGNAWYERPGKFKLSGGFEFTFDWFIFYYVQVNTTLGVVWSEKVKGGIYLNSSAQF